MVSIESIQDWGMRQLYNVDMDLAIQILSWIWIPVSISTTYRCKVKNWSIVAKPRLIFVFVIVFMKLSSSENIIRASCPFSGSLQSTGKKATTGWNSTPFLSIHRLGHIKLQEPDAWQNRQKICWNDRINFKDGFLGRKTLGVSSTYIRKGILNGLSMKLRMIGFISILVSEGRSKVSNCLVDASPGSNSLLVSPIVLSWRANFWSSKFSIDPSEISSSENVVF